MQLGYAWSFLCERMVSRSFAVFFAVATDLYLADVFLAAYAKNNLPLVVWEKIYSTFGMEKLGTIYVGSVLDALIFSTILAYGFSKLKSRLFQRATGTD